MSSGFWFGDERSYPEPAFYSYTAPEPDEMQRQPLEPAAARWTESNRSHLALLPYDDVRTTPDAPAEILRFCDTAYAAGARLAGWNTDRLCPGGVTDPQAPAQHIPGPEREPRRISRRWARLRSADADPNTRQGRSSPWPSAVNAGSEASTRAKPTGRTSTGHRRRDAALLGPAIRG
ncbi:DUF5996 family protein [Streptomyces anulatus]|uniref:DUF5996 family protein n=1 Tax=Streptomyces anulatus TaxID=1892 RepID=UPI00386C1362